MKHIITLSKAGTDEAGRTIPNLQGRKTVQGMSLAIENKAGTYRHWYDPDGKEKGKTKMLNDYGYIQKTMGMDGDKVDVYLGPNPQAPNVYVVHQMKAPDFKKYDEDKCMVGFDSPSKAKEAYLKHYNTPKFFGSMTEMTLDQFKKKAYKRSLFPQMIKAVKMNYIVGFGTNSLNAVRAGKGQPLHYVLPDTSYKDKRTYDKVKQDHITLRRFEGMLSRGEMKQVMGEFPNISASEIRGHLHDIYSRQSSSS